MSTKFLFKKKILMIHQRDWAIKHGFEISKKLSKYGAKLASLNFKLSTEYFIENQKDIDFEYILNESNIDKNYKSILKESNYTIENLKNDFEIENIWKYALTLRQFTLNYKKKYPFSYQQNYSDENIRDYILAFAFELKKMFQNFTPDIVIGYNFGDIRHLLLERLCNKKKIPFFFVSDTKVQNISTFYYDINSSKSFFQHKIKNLKNKANKPKKYNKALNYLKQNKYNLEIPLHMKNLDLKKNWYNFTDFKNLIFKLKYHFGKSKSNNVTIADHTNIWFILRDYFSERKNIIDNQNYEYDNLNEIENFVYFPMQHFPESQLGLLNPIHDHTLNAIRTIARFLPSKYKLVVKDHPWSFGKRSKSFLDKIKNTLNVKLIDPNTNNNQLLRKMSYLVSYGGTVIFESLIINKPAINIGNLKMMNQIKGIYQLNELNKIGNLIKEIDTEFYSQNMQKNIEESLLNYISSAFEYGFPADIYHSDLRFNAENLDIMWNYYLEELKKIEKFRGKFVYD